MHPPHSGNTAAHLKMTLTHIWNFLCFLTTASAVILLYPSVNSSETLTCRCPDHRCQKVHWYRLLDGSETPEFIVSTNNINSVHYAPQIDRNRIRTRIENLGKVSYTLHIAGLQKKDAGFYSCLLSSQNSAQDPKDLMPEGYFICPAEMITTRVPTTVKKKKRVNRLLNRCKSTNQSPKGCKSLVLWSGVGAVLLLLVVLISTLYYFSRLPKKCRHHFAKKRQLS